MSFIWMTYTCTNRHTSCLNRYVNVPELYFILQHCLLLTVLSLHTCRCTFHSPILVLKCICSSWSTSLSSLKYCFKIKTGTIWCKKKKRKEKKKTIIITKATWMFYVYLQELKCDYFDGPVWHFCYKMMRNNIWCFIKLFIGIFTCVTI